MMEDEEEELLRLQKQKKKLVSKNDLRSLSEVYNRCGDILYHQGKFEAALEEHKAEESTCVAINDLLGIGNANRKISECLTELGKFDEAYNHQRVHLEKAIEANSLLEQQRAWATMGWTYVIRAETIMAAVVIDERKKLEFLDRADNAYKSSLEICSKMSISDVSPYEREQMKGRLYLNRAIVFDYIDDLKNCAAYIEQAISIHSGQCQWIELYKAHNSIAHIYQRRQDWAKSLHHADEAIKIATRLKNVEYEGNSQFLKGKIQLHQQSFLEAKVTFKKCYKLALLSGQDLNLTKRLLKYASNLNSEQQILKTVDKDNFSERLVHFEKLGDLCSAVELFKLSIKYYRLALECSKALGNSGKVLAPLYASLAQTYADDNKFNEASSYYKLELECWDNNPEEKCKTLINLADYKIKMGRNYENVCGVFRAALTEAFKSKNRYHQKQCLQQLSDYQDSCRKVDEHRITQISLQDYDDVNSSEEENSDEDSDSSLLISESEESENEVPMESKSNTRAKSSRCYQMRTNEKGETPLHRACIAGNLTAVKKILEQNINVNVRDNSGWTPLHEAANIGHLDICKMLVERGALLSDRGGDHCDGITPLHDAATNCNLEVMEYLINKGASCIAKNNKGLTALDSLAEWRELNKDKADPMYISESIKLEKKWREEKINKAIFMTNVDEKSEHMLNYRDSKNDSALVADEEMLPDRDDWIIDDVNKSEGVKKRKQGNLRNFVERLLPSNSEKSTRRPRRRSIKSKIGNFTNSERFKSRKRKRSIENSQSSQGEPESLEMEIDNESPEMNDLSFEQPIKTQRGISINVKVLETVFSIPVPKDENIGWLNEEAAEKYYSFSGQKPILILVFNDNVLRLDEQIASILKNEDEVIAQFQSWKVVNSHERYLEACKQLKIKVVEDVRDALSKAELSLVADFANIKMETETFLTALRSIQSFINLRELILSGNYFDSKLLQLLALLLLRLPHLQSLDLSNSDLSDESFSHLSEILKEKSLPSIRYLKLGFNPLLDEGCKHFSSFLKCFAGAESLSIPSISTSFNFQMDKHFIKSLLHLKNLKDLDLSFNKISFSIFEELIFILSKLPLVKLNLTSIVFNADVLPMCKSLKNYFQKPTTKIKELNLSMCFLNDECINILSSGLKSMNLDNLNLIGNHEFSKSTASDLLAFLPNDKLIISTSNDEVDESDYELNSQNSPTF